MPTVSLFEYVTAKIDEPPLTPEEVSTSSGTRAAWFRTPDASVLWYAAYAAGVLRGAREGRNHPELHPNSARQYAVVYRGASGYHIWRLRPMVESMDGLRTQGTYGPFRPNIPIKVPLYLALSLYRRGKCRIQLPNWMTKEELKGVTEGVVLLASAPPQSFKPSSAVLPSVTRALTRDAGGGTHTPAVFSARTTVLRGSQQVAVHGGACHLWQQQ
jgi:hypothetical protein